MARSGRALGRALAGGLAAAPPPRTAAVRYAGRRRSDCGGDSPTAAAGGVSSRGTAAPLPLGASGRPGSPQLAGQPRCVPAGGVGPPEARCPSVRSAVKGAGRPAARGAVLAEPLPGSPRPGERGAAPGRRWWLWGRGEGRCSRGPPRRCRSAGGRGASASVAVGSVSVEEQTIIRL